MLMWSPLELHHLLSFQQLLSNQSQPQNQHSYLVNPLKKKLLRNPQMKKIQLKNQTKFLQQQNSHLHLPNLQRKL
ncbi:hypothetical protein MEQ_05215 [Candida albicans P87]|nr:hypothetical protein MG1_05278 [Candida albicans GC75]KGU02791.1 hypothetical protein MEQ_05215 [Candida albicans P87]